MLKMNHSRGTIRKFLTFLDTAEDEGAGEDVAEGTADDIGEDTGEAVLVRLVQRQ